MSKQTDRQHLLSLRDRIPKNVHAEASATICHQLIALLAPLHGRFGSYLAVGSEVNLDALHDAIWSAGGALFVPKIRSQTHMDFVALNGADELIAGQYGIQTSIAEEPTPIETFDALLIPCSGFDRRGHRLGMGGGYYDRRLAEQSPRAPLRIGVAFALQEAVVEPEPWDQPFDLIVSECEIIRP